MPINRVLQGSSLEPDEIRVLNDAYEDALRALYLIDRNDPVTEIVARKIIQVGQSGARDPHEIAGMAIKALGLS
jgi:hypothetical protein